MSSHEFGSPYGVRPRGLKRSDSLVVLLCLLPGCGDKGYETVPVSGCVTLDGKPLADVGLTFVPLAKDTKGPDVGPGSIGKTDANGRFVLQTVRGEKGAVPTEHVVRMEMSSDQGDMGTPEGFGPEGANVPRPTARTSLLPRNALDGSLHFEVPPQGTDQANFDLVSR